MFMCDRQVFDANKFFQNQQSGLGSLNSALDKVSVHSQNLLEKSRSQAAQYMEGQNSSGPSISSVDLSSMNTCVSAACNGSNEDVEKLEYGWTCNALTSNLLELWFGHGLMGMPMQDAYGAVFGFLEANPQLNGSNIDFNNPSYIRDVFGNISVIILGIPGSYIQQPNLWG